ncbi:furin, partial [Schistosoma bovis]
LLDWQVQEIKQLKILNVQKRFTVYNSEFDAKVAQSLKKTPLPKEMMTESDAEYNRQYIEYAKRIRSAVNVNDPAAYYVWQYLNDGNSVSPLIGLDINLYPIFLEDVTGRGTNVVILDDGLDTSHPDLQANYDETISVNMDRPQENGLSPRGPRKIIPENDGHGTRCAGLAGAVINNSFCSHGVAPKTKLGGIRMLTGPVTDFVEAKGLSYKVELINIFCSSWGPSDDGITMDLPHKYAKDSLSHGLAKGRNGLGSIYIFASGNGGLFGDSCGADGFVSSPDVIAVSAVDNLGQKTMYSEPCSAIRVSVPVGGSPEMSDMNILVNNNNEFLSFIRVIVNYQ